MEAPKKYDLVQFSQIYQEWKKQGSPPLHIYINETDKKIEAIYGKKPDEIGNLKALTHRRFQKMKFNETPETSDNEKMFRSSFKMLQIYFTNRKSKFHQKTMNHLMTLGQSYKIDDNWRQSPKKWADILQTVVSVERSGAGSKGVYFCRCEGVATIPVLKLVQQGEADRFILADSLFTALGYKSCHTKAVPDLDKESICMSIEKKVDISGLNHTANLVECLKQREVCLVMKKVEGQPLNQLKRRKLLQLVNSSSFLSSLGEIIFIDHFIGNLDRMNPKSSNLGNIMVDRQDEIVLIDQQFCLGFPIIQGHDILPDAIYSFPKKDTAKEIMPEVVAKEPNPIFQSKFQLLSLNFSEISKEEEIMQINSQELYLFLSGERTKEIVEAFCEELTRKRALQGAPDRRTTNLLLSEVTADTKELMINHINRGILAAFDKLCQLLTGRATKNIRYKVFGMKNFVEQQNLACKLIEELVELKKNHPLKD